MLILETPPQPSPPRPQRGSTGAAHASEARLLADSLRSSPATVLMGGDAALRARLLQDGLLPLLARRAGDQRARAASPLAAEVPRPHRPGHLARPVQSAEAVLAFDAAEPASLQDWRNRLARLRQPADSPGRTQRHLVLLASDAAVEPAADWVALCDALLRGLLAHPPAWHVLIASDDAECQPYAHWSAVLPSLRDNALHLARPRQAATSAPQPGVPRRAAAGPGAQAEGAGAGADPAEPAEPAEPADPADPIVVELSSLHGRQTTAVARRSHEPRRPRQAAPALRGTLRGTLRTTLRTTLTATLPLLASGLVLLLLRQPGDQPSPAAVPAAGSGLPAPARAAAAAAPAPRPAPRPAPIPSDPGIELMAALQPLHTSDLRQAGPAELAGALAASPSARLVVLRYDSLQGLPRQSLPPDLQLVTPLFVEPVLVWVKAEAGWRHWQDLAGLRWDIGARGSSTEATAARLQQAVFGAAQAAVRQTADEGRQAQAQAQTAAATADVRLRVGWPQAMATPAGWRTLPLRDQDAGTQRVWQGYLPVPLTRALSAAALPDAAALPTAGTTPAVMNFLAVLGGGSSEREALARRALQSLCAALPALQQHGAAGWAGAPVGRKLPAGLAYAQATETEGRGCATEAAGPVRPALRMAANRFPDNPDNLTGVTTLTNPHKPGNPGNPGNPGKEP